MTFKILIMGLPGAGKSTLANELRKLLSRDNSKVIWLNADAIRDMFNDWDFSQEGRIRQSYRMHTLAVKLNGDFTICDFVAPLEEMRAIFAADYTVWVDTITQGRYEDTNKAFTPPSEYNIRVTEQNAKKWAEIIANDIIGQQEINT